MSDLEDIKNELDRAFLPLVREGRALAEVKAVRQTAQRLLEEAWNEGYASGLGHGYANGVQETE